jgi:hypothetical protein
MNNKKRSDEALVLSNEIIDVKEKRIFFNHSFN